MRIAIAYDIGCLRRWHIWLANALGENHDVVLTGIQRATPFPRSLSLLQSLERILYRRSGTNASDVCDSREYSGAAITGKPAAGQFDLVIDLSSGMSAASPDLRILAPLYNGTTDELAAANALLNHELVDFAIYDSAHGAYVSHGWSAAEDRNVLSISLDNVFCRTGSLLQRAAEHATPSFSASGHSLRADALLTKSRSPIPFLAAAVRAKALALLNKLCGRGHEWAIAWRRTHGDAISDRLPDSGLAFQRHPNNPRSYFADPFVFARDGRHYLFVEEYLHAQGKGVISLMTIERDGTVSPSTVILERPYHLSYPFVFEHGGEIYMIPETGAARRVELYRAERFPDLWVFHSVLMDDVAARDVTLCEHKGRLWLFMATGQWQSSSWDTLEIYHAANLESPWTPLPNNPVLASPTGTRPGGSMFWRSGELWRPAQDSSVIYGGKLALCRVDELSSDKFRQTTTSFLAPAPSLAGVHTLNYAAGLETVDIFGPRSEEPARLVIERAAPTDSQFQHVAPEIALI